ncbi:MAG: host attachment protein [Pseudomonadota bacterium]
MSTTWILVSNASSGKLFRNTGPNKGLEMVKAFEHPQSREKNSNLVSDRPGHNPGAGNGHGSFVPATSPKEHEADVFALELARELDSGRVANQFARLVLVAPPAFLGQLNQRMSDALKALVSDRLEKDYTRASDRELARHLASCVCL